MSCTPQENRPQRIISTEMDMALLAEAQRYATEHGVTFQTLVEASLIQFMINDMTPLPLRVCAAHGVVMEGNSIGTIESACPIHEGASPDNTFYLGGETT